ncbi:CotH kinase family protein [Winogradskyella litorisediminis]|uniref:CotH kinase family protein n=1 Tax=Winogradskyella litorisediminis TaxID=1156618 RepID=A0ABW3NAZ8_9FLAO
MKHTIALIFLLFFVSTSCSQDIIAEKGSYGIDIERKIIVWHQTNLASQNVKSITFDKTYVFDKKGEKLTHNNAISVKADTKYKLYITKLPIIHISMNDAQINSRKKIEGKFSYYDDKQFVESVMGVRHRGNLSLSFDKKSFDLELWKDATTQESVDAQFLHMRSDDDWILDAMFNEPIRLRSFVATNLWNETHKPYYLGKEPEAKSGFDVAYVEVFKNNKYYGLYQLMESVDRKQLQVKKNKGDTIRGRIYRANSYEGGPDFSKASPEYDNVFKSWIGWESNYPFIDYTSDFGDLSRFQNLVVNSSNEDFKTKISEEFVLDNAIDYYIFVNIIRATDNLGKNYSLAKYDANQPYFIVPWDLDGTFGVIQDGKRIATTDDVLTNGLFKRLIAQNPQGYKGKLKTRWKELRGTVYNDRNLFSKIDAIYNSFTDELVYEREFLVWQNKLNELSNAEHYAYLEDWLKKRLAYLDRYFEGL